MKLLQIKELRILFLLTLLSKGLPAQDTTWVKEGDKRFMHREAGTWSFNDHLPDGHYYAYRWKNKKDIAIEISFANTQKEGSEYRFYDRDTQKYAIINWNKGKKNGPYIIFNTNRTIRYMLNFKDGEVDGYSEINWSGGEKKCDGYYKNGYRDSIWAFYQTNPNSKNISLYEQWQYRNGKPYLIAKWDSDGQQLVANQNNTWIKGLDYKPTPYLNGLKHGDDSLQGFLNEPNEVQTYTKGLLTKELLYNDSGKVLSISEWTYPKSERADTFRSSVDTYIPHIYFNEIIFTNDPVPYGYWMACYPNGVKKYEGNFSNGKRTGKWIWLYPSGKPRIIADYNANTWQHYDSSGILRSTFQGEYLSMLEDGYWFLNQSLDKRRISLLRSHHKTVTPKLIFHYDGKLGINDFLECGKDIGFSLNTYTLLADTLFIHSKSSKNTDRSRTFRVLSASQSKITLKRIK